jgi:hypothetical protein
VERSCAKGFGWEEWDAVEVLELGFDNLRDSRDIKVIVGSVVGEIPRNTADCAEGFGLETLDALDVGLVVPL